MRKQPRTAARRAVLILTDNRSIKMKRDDTVVRELWEADTVLNGLIFESTMERVANTYHKVVNPLNLVLDADATKIASQTGGESLRAGAAFESFRDMVDRIRRRYNLHYRQPPGPAGKPRTIRVNLVPAAAKAHPKLTIRSRRGYIPIPEAQ
jgi:hypothetical protein